LFPPCILHVLPISSCVIYRPNRTGWRVQTVNLLIM
jgi:hypothetical protein